MVPYNWSGKIWPRTGCHFNGSSGHCETGDCNNKLACGGAGSDLPATHVHIILNHGINDIYYISLAEGFNLPVLVRFWLSFPNINSLNNSKAY